VLSGQSLDWVTDLTPRQTFAFAYFAYIDRLDQLRASLAVAALGAQGDEKAIEKQLEKWSL
jgi:hypothetical protein